MTDETYEKREWVSRAVLRMAPYIDLPSNDSSQQIFGIAIYDRDAGEACFVSTYPPDGDVITHDIVDDLISDLENFKESSQEIIWALTPDEERECEGMEKPDE